MVSDDRQLSVFMTLQVKILEYLKFIADLDKNVFDSTLLNNLTFDEGF